MIAAIQLPAKPTIPAPSQGEEMRRGLGMDEAQDRLIAGDASRDEDRGDDEQPGDPLSADRAQKEGDAQRERRGRIAEVVDQVGEQGDAAAGEEDRDLGESGDSEHRQRETNRLQSLAGAFDALVNQAVGVPVIVTVVRWHLSQMPVGT